MNINSIPTLSVGKSKFQWFKTIFDHLTLNGNFAFIKRFFPKIQFIQFISMDDFWLFRTCVRCIDKCPLEVVFEEDGTKKNVFSRKISSDTYEK